MDENSESNLLNTSQGTIENLIQKLNDSYNIRRKLEAEIKVLKETINSPMKSQAKNGKATLEKDKEYLSKSLHAADLKIESLTIQNDILRRELNEVRQRSITLEDLLKESSSGLEKLQSKIDIDATEIVELNEKLQSAEAKNASLQRSNLVLQARIRREEQNVNNNSENVKIDRLGTSPAVKKSNPAAAASAITTTTTMTPISDRHKKFHISVRDTLRLVADQLCDQLVQVEEQLELSKTFVKVEEPDPYQSNAGRQTRHGRNTSKSSSSSQHNNSPHSGSSSSPQKPIPDFQFGRPSAREVLSIVQEIDEEETEYE